MSLDVGRRIGEKVSVIRKSKGYGQEQLAELLGVSRSSICNKEKYYREQTFSVVDMAKIANWLEVDVATFYLDITDNHRSQFNGRMARSKPANAEPNEELYLSSREMSFIKIIKKLDDEKMNTLFSMAVGLLVDES